MATASGGGGAGMKPAPVSEAARPPGQRPAVQAVEHVHVHVMGKLRGLADPGDEHDLVLLPAELLHRLLYRVQDPEVSAPLAPCVLDIRVERASHILFLASGASVSGVKGRPS